MNDQPTSRRRRWPLLLLAIVAVGVAVARLALPGVVRWLVLREAGALAARVSIDDVDLALWRGRLTLAGVEIRDLQPPRSGPDDPLLRCRRLAATWSWGPLLRRRLQVVQLELDGPRVALDRLADGNLNLAALLPKPTAAAVPPARTWTVAVDHLLLSDGGLRFRDLAVPDGLPIEATVDRIDVARLAFEPGVFGKPTRVHLDLAVEEGRFALSARLALHPGGVAIAATARGARLPLSRVRVYGPSLGWSDLAGEWGATLHYRYVPAGEHTLRGRLALDDVAVHVPQRATPALALRRLDATLDPIDFRHHRATVPQIALRGATLPVEPLAASPVPLFAGPTPAPPAAATTPAEASWTIAIGSLGVTESQLLVPATQALALEVSARNAVAGGTRRTPLRVALRAGDASATFDGATRFDRLDLGGKLALRRASLPAIVRTFDWLPPDVLQVGRADADLQVELDGDRGDLRLTGPLTVDDLWIAAADPHECSLGAARISGRLDGTRVPGVAKPDPDAAIEVRAKDLDLDAPYAELVRTATGWVSPQSGGAAETPPSVPATPAPSPLVAIDVAHATGARCYVTDRTVTPFFLGGLDPFELELQKVRWPAGTVEYIGLDGKTPERGRLQARGWLVPSGNQLDVEATGVALLPFNPYVAAYSSYSFARGRLSGTGTAWFGPWGWDGRSHLVLHDFDLASRAGDSLFREQYGVSLSVALPLLRDTHGDIALDVPLSVDAAGTRVGVSTVVTGAVERALVNTLSAPAKLLASILPSRDGAEAEELPGAIAFQVGRAEPASDAVEQLRRLGAFLAGRPGLAVRLVAGATDADAHWLAEQALRQRLDAGAKMGGADPAAVARIRAALRDWQAGGTTAIADADAALLDRWLDEHRATPAALQSLATNRLEYVRSTLERRFGLARGRVAVNPPAATLADGAPAVLPQIEPLNR